MAEVKDINEAINAIRMHCKNTPRCDGCVYHEPGIRCKFNMAQPSEWRFDSNGYNNKWKHRRIFKNER